MAKLSRNLSWSELLRGSGYDALEDVPDEIRANAENMAASMFQPLRDSLGFPLSVLAGGGLRSASMNRRVGGARTSQHMAGRGCDLRGPSETHTLQIYDRAKDMQASGLIPAGGLALYLRKDGTVRFVHVDCRGRRARWNGGARKLALA